MSAQVKSFLVWLHVVLAVFVIVVVTLGFIAGVFSVAQAVVVVISMVVVAFASTQL